MASLAYKERLSENLTSELRQQIRQAEGTSLMKMRCEHSNEREREFQRLQGRGKNLVHQWNIKMKN